MELYIEHNRFNQEVKIFLEEVRGVERVVIGYDGDNLTQTTIQTNTCSPDGIKPFLKLPTDIYQILLKLFKEQAEKEGVISENESVTMGKLIATEKHLEDMREAFKKLLTMKSK